MPSNHLILCRHLLLQPSIFPSIKVFSNESVPCIRWPTYWSFSFSISLSNEQSGLISFRIDWLDLFALQGILRSPLQHDSSKASILWCSAFFIVQLSHPKKQQSSRKTSTSALLTMPKPLTVWNTTNCGKFFKRWEHQTTWPASWETCMQRTGHGTTDWFQIGKGVHQGFTLSPCLFNLYAEYITRNAGLEEAQAGIKISGRNIHNLRYADDTTLMAESEEELKSLLMKVRGEWKSWLKAQHSEN